jgi:S1-C subfamily serine protease
MVEDFLSQRGVGFTKRDVSIDPNAAQELISSTGQMGVPVTLINGQTIVGFDREKLEQALNQKQRPSFGASVADASKITAKQGTGIILGAYIGKIKPNSSARRIGLAPGDIITELNMQNIANATDFENAVSKLSKGSRLTIVFLRGDKKLSSEGFL